MQEKLMLAVRHALTPLVLLLLVPGGGCAGESVDLGDDGAGLEEDQDAALRGTWVGDLSGPAFLTHPKPVRLVIDDNGQGTLLVGATPLAPPTDPTVGYPPEAQADAAEASGMLVHLYEGVEYALQNVVVTGQALQFQVDAFQAFEPWCRLQTPVWTDVAQYRCRENWGGRVDRSDGQKRCFVMNPETGEEFEEDCLALSLCSISSSGCHCTASECFASDAGDPAIATFDLQLNEAGTILEGEQSFAHERGPTTVQLTRVQD